MCVWPRDPLFRLRVAKVSVTKYRFFNQLPALELRDQTLARLPQSLENSSEPLDASTVWGTFSPDWLRPMVDKVNSLSWT